MATQNGQKDHNSKWHNQIYALDKTFIQISFSETVQHLISRVRYNSSLLFQAADNFIVDVGRIARLHVLPLR